jgi:hypothetical protein
MLQRTVLLVVLVSTVFGQAGSPVKREIIGNGTWWRNPDYAQTLKLTPSQIDTMERAFAEHVSRISDLNADFEKGKAKWDAIWRTKLAPDAELAELSEKLAENRKQFLKENARLQQLERQILNADQWANLIAIRDRSRYEPAAAETTRSN